MEREYHVAAFLAFKMTQRGRAWSEVAEHMRAFCAQHGLVPGVPATHRPDMRPVTVLEVRSAVLFTRPEAETLAAELTRELASFLPHQAKLCRPLAKRGFKPWNRMYAQMADAMAQMAD